MNTAKTGGGNGLGTRLEAVCASQSRKAAQCRNETQSPLCPVYQK